VSHVHLIEAGDDLVEQAQAVHALVPDLLLLVVVVEAGDGGEHHAHLVVGLGVKLLRRPTRREAEGVVSGKNKCDTWDETFAHDMLKL